VLNLSRKTARLRHFPLTLRLRQTSCRMTAWQTLQQPRTPPQGR